MSKPPQWLLDEVIELPREVRGYAMAFLAAGWYAGLDAALEAMDRTYPRIAMDLADPTERDRDDDDAG